MDLNKKVADKIRDIRLSKPFSAEEVARMLEKSKSAYSQLENGKTEISISTLEKLSKVLNEPLMNFLPIPTSSVVIAHDNATGFIGNQINNGVKEEIIISLTEAFNLLHQSIQSLKK